MIEVVRFRSLTWNADRESGRIRFDGLMYQETFLPEQRSRSWNFLGAAELLARVEREGVWPDVRGVEPIQIDDGKLSYWKNEPSDVCWQKMKNRTIWQIKPTLAYYQAKLLEPPEVEGGAGLYATTSSVDGVMRAVQDPGGWFSYSRRWEGGDEFHFMRTFDVNDASLVMSDSDYVAPTPICRSWHVH